MMGITEQRHMEHRWTGRVPTSRQVLVYLDTGVSLLCAARNISVEGLYVVTDPYRRRMYPGAFVEVGLIPCSGDSLQVLHVPAMIIHVEPDGAGLMFISREAQTVDRIAELVADCRRESAALRTQVN